MQHTFNTLINFSATTLAQLAAELIATFADQREDGSFDFRNQASQQTFDLLLAAGTEATNTDRFWDMIGDARGDAWQQTN